VRVISHFAKAAVEIVVSKSVGYVVCANRLKSNRAVLRRLKTIKIADRARLSVLFDVY
jgi:hypothetical protein